MRFSASFGNYLDVTYLGENGTASWFGALQYIDHDTTLACMDGGLDGIAFRCAWRDIHLVYYVIFSLFSMFLSCEYIAATDGLLRLYSSAMMEYALVYW